MLQIVIPDQYITIGILENKMVSVDWSKIKTENNKKDMYDKIAKYLREAADFMEEEKNCPEM
jgi:D-alanine-D-alanine ligase-like ATP-grasp enzyme